MVKCTLKAPFRLMCDDIGMHRNIFQKHGVCRWIIENIFFMFFLLEVKIPQVSKKAGPEARRRPQTVERDRQTFILTLILQFSENTNFEMSTIYVVWVGYVWLRDHPSYAVRTAVTGLEQHRDGVFCWLKVFGTDYTNLKTSERRRCTLWFPTVNWSFKFSCY